MYQFTFTMISNQNQATTAVSSNENFNKLNDLLDIYLQKTLSSLSLNNIY